MKKLWYGKFKWAKRIVIILFLLGIIGTLAILGISHYVIRYTEPSLISDREAPSKKTDCILVLGAGLTPDGQPSLVLRDRLEKAVTLYQEGVSDRLLMSGDHGQDSYDEVYAMKQYAISAGIPEDNIFMDHAGFSTYESIYRAKEIFQVKRVAIVTQPYHIYRALYIADKLGMEAYGTPSVPTKYRGSWMLELREKLARTKDFFKAIAKPEPTYLGNPIPITGSGSATSDGT